MLKENIMDSNYLKKEEKLLESYVTRLAGKQANDNVQPIYDGIIDIDSYLSSKLKIAWILKEPYDDEDECGGGWSLSESIQEDISKNKPKSFNRTLKMIAKISYSLFNNFCSFDDSNFPGENNCCWKSLKQIAIININKLPAHRTSGDMSIEYSNWKPILFWQLYLYNPNIIIFGNTYNYFADDLRLGEKYKFSDSSYFLIKDKQLFIDVYHPARKGKDYFNDIVDIVKNNISN